jgi:hypothetical protein
MLRQKVLMVICEHCTIYSLPHILAPYEVISSANCLHTAYSIHLPLLKMDLAKKIHLHVSKEV